MKTRTVVHIALNAKNDRVGVMVVAAGNCIPIGDRIQSSFKNRAAKTWLTMDFVFFPSVDYWKEWIKRYKNAVRFQRVTLIGESK